MPDIKNKFRKVLNELEECYENIEYCEDTREEWEARNELLKLCENMTRKFGTFYGDFPDEEQESNN